MAYPLNCFILQCITFLILYFTLHLGEAQKKEMKAMVVKKFGRTRDMLLLNVSIPKVDDDQLLLKVMATGINPIDAHIRSGRYPKKPDLPSILGIEVAGVVRKKGTRVINFEKSDRVFCRISKGGYAEFAVANASNCYQLPGKLSFTQGAALYVTYFSVARGLIQKANLTKDDVVLIHGAKGSFGSAAVQVAKAAGATVVATVSTTEANALMKKSKADYIVEENLDNYMEMALEKCEKDAFDVIVEINTNADVMDDKKYLAPYGRIVIFGYRPAIANRFHSAGPEEGSLVQLDLSNVTETEQQQAAEFVMNGIEKNWILPIIGRGYKLEEAGLAHEDIEKNKGDRGKLVFIF